ncbi:MAG: ABC transporter permease [Verrucomicrobiota bacterium]
MKLGNTIKISFRALRRNKMRSILTALGIIIGVAAVIAMVSIGNGAKSQMESQIASLGENVILVFSGNFSPGGVRSGWGGAGTLKIEDALAIKREIPTVSAVSPEVRSNGQLSAGNENWSTGNLLGESADYFDIRQWPLAQGATFTEQDTRMANKVAVIGQTVAKQLYREENPLGQVLRIKNVPFIVTGVLTPKGLNLMGQDQDDIVVLPYTSAMKRVSGNTNLRSINIQGATKNDLASTKDQIISLLRQRHRIGAQKEDDFTVRTQEEIAKVATAQTDVMTALLGAIASVSLLVGGIGIMNIMLVSVTERTREIGIRMAVGAHGKDILLQFLIEAAALSSTGGVIGIILGVVASKTVSGITGWPSLISVSSIMVSFLVSSAVGIFFGFYPARKAARLDPIEALRFE